MKKKKDFKENVNEMFLSNDEPEILEEEKPEIRAEEKPTPIEAARILAPETKSVRLQLLIRPTTNKALAKEAKRRRISKNELVNQILEEHIKGANYGNR